MATTSTGTARATPRRTSVANRSTAPTGRADRADGPGGVRASWRCGAEAHLARSRRPRPAACASCSRSSCTLAAQEAQRERASAAKVEKHGRKRSADGRRHVIPSPNIWESPDVYELENRGVDRAGVIETAMREVVDWAGKDLLDIGCGTGYHLPWFATTRARWSGWSRTRRSWSAPVTGYAALPSVRVEEGVGGATTVLTRVLTSRTRAGPTSSVRVASRVWPSWTGVMRPGGTAFVVDNDATRSTFGTWFRRALPSYDPARSSGSGCGRGGSESASTSDGPSTPRETSRRSGDRVPGRLWPTRSCAEHGSHRRRLRRQPLVAALLTDRGHLGPGPLDGTSPVWALETAGSAVRSCRTAPSVRRGRLLVVSDVLGMMGP